MASKRANFRKEGYKMGLDMYLHGEKFNWTPNRTEEKKMDGYDVNSVTLDLGYWRKHPNLHGYIVQKYASGKDECQKIELDEEALQDILKVSESDNLPTTEGFFFGESREEDKAETKDILEKAIIWVATKEKDISRSVYYEASW